MGEGINRERERVIEDDDECDASTGGMKGRRHNDGYE